jgi:hypothetical protein
MTTHDRTNAKLILEVATVAGSFLIGYTAAVWVTHLDPDGSGGSILAFPAILSVTAVSALAFIVGMSSLGTNYGRYFLFSVILIPMFFFVATGWFVR